jgi:hypothetical protein
VSEEELWSFKEEKVLNMYQRASGMVKKRGRGSVVALISSQLFSGSFFRSCDLASFTISLCRMSVCT